MISHIKVYFALLGLSHNTMYDETTGQDVPFRLTQIERNAIMQMLEPKDVLNLIYEAEDYFAKKETLFFKPSRYLESPLKSLNVRKELEEQKNNYKALTNWCLEN